MILGWAPTVSTVRVTVFVVRLVLITITLRTVCAAPQLHQPHMFRWCVVAVFTAHLYRLPGRRILVGRGALLRRRILFRWRCSIFLALTDITLASADSPEIFHLLNYQEVVFFQIIWHHIKMIASPIKSLSGKGLACVFRFFNVVISPGV